MSGSITVIATVDEVTRIDPAEQIDTARPEVVRDNTIDPVNDPLRMDQIQRDLTLAQRQLDVIQQEDLVQRQDILQREDILARQDPAQVPLDPAQLPRDPAHREVDPASREPDPAQREIDPANRERPADQIQRNFDIAQEDAAKRIDAEEAYVPDVIVVQSQGRPAGS
jgi:hypothetical protein